MNLKSEHTRLETRASSGDAAPGQVFRDQVGEYERREAGGQSDNKYEIPLSNSQYRKLQYEVGQYINTTNDVTDNTVKPASNYSFLGKRCTSMAFTWLKNSDITLGLNNAISRMIHTSSPAAFREYLDNKSFIKTESPPPAPTPTTPTAP